MINDFPFYWLVFLLPLFFLIVVVAVMLHFYRKFKRLAKEEPERFLDQVASAGKGLGPAAAYLQCLRKNILGEKIKDLGVIERRNYRGLIVEHSLGVYKSAWEEHPVLQIKEFSQSGLVEFFSAKGISVYFYPLGANASRALADILGADEKIFLGQAHDYEQMRRRREKGLSAWLKSMFQKIFFAQILKDFGIIEKISRPITLKARQKAIWFQQISALIGKENKEIILILKFVVRHRFKSGFFPGVMKSRLYYPFGAASRQSLRQALTHK